MNLTPTIIQDANTKQVLMLGFSTEESLAKTKATGQVWFYSRRKQRLWQKGETSGNYLKVITINTDCDQDATLITVEPAGPTCHTGQVSCFGETVQDVMNKLEQVIQQRQRDLPADSYTTQLLQAGPKMIANKVIEEVVEVVQAVRFEGNIRLTEETVDLLYHLVVLLRVQGVSWQDVLQVLQQREHI